MEHLAAGKASKSKKLNKGEISTFEEANESRWERLLKEGMLSILTKRNRRTQKDYQLEGEKKSFFLILMLYSSRCV